MVDLTRQHKNRSDVLIEGPEIKVQPLRNCSTGL
jgi:hypothetical protein